MKQAGREGNEGIKLGKQTGGGRKGREEERR